MGNNRIGKGLTLKQNLFVCEYCSNGGNASAAARAAGYSKKTAKVIGTENLTKPAIRAAIDARIDVRVEKLENQYNVTEERITHEMALLAFSNAADYYDNDGKLKPINKLTRDQAAAIVEISEKSYGRTEAAVFERKYKIADKKAMLDMLAKYKKLYNQDDEAGSTKQELPTININFPDNGR